MGKMSRGSDWRLREAQRRAATGLRGTSDNIAKLKNRVDIAALRGLVLGVKQVRRDMDDVPPKIPVDTNNLRLSFFIVTSTARIERGTAPKFNDKNQDQSAVTISHAQAVTEAVVKAQEKSNRGPVVALGFGAYYALYVHEKTGTFFGLPTSGRSRWKRPGSGPKFLEAHVKRNSNFIKASVMEEIRKVIS